MNNLEGLARPLPHPHILRRLYEHGNVHYAQRKAMQKFVSKKSQNRIYNLWNNHSFYIGNKTLTSTLVVLVRPPHPGIERHNHFHFVTRGVVILSNDDTIRACLNFAE